ncbi:hypothetical protein E2C01_087056 [Portunus trituberculatus]|uniref:Uncharacterized protein n=1 Tax=Portunus trituberculatus TaxID=210409 RepID=A0A5B7JGA1_PORTR|nr:hypothetical protein [Portunus trituberculatus]
MVSPQSRNLPSLVINCGALDTHTPRVNFCHARHRVIPMRSIMSEIKWAYLEGAITHKKFLRYVGNH